MHRKYSLFVGRWQPFHNGHRYIVEQALKEGKNVCIACRETPVSNSDPYTFEQRVAMINRVFANYGDRVKVISIPDIESVNIGRNVGYDVNEIQPPPDIASISGTGVRSLLENVPDQLKNIPVETQRFLYTLHGTVWFTGLPCSGKTTLCKAVLPYMQDAFFSPIHLDGDMLRETLNNDLGFSESDRHENLRRIASVSEFLNKSRQTTLCSFVSPSNQVRAMVRNTISKCALVYVRCPLGVCEERDVKGMYRLAREGKIPDFTGIGAPYEEPEDADLVIDTAGVPLDECVAEILRFLDVRP